LFLCLSAGAFLAAQRGRFVAAGAAAALAAVTRASGILLVPILALIYLAARDFDGRRIRADVVSLLLPFAALAAHAAYLGRLSGDSLALVHAQAAWGRHLAWPWQTLTIKGHLYVGQVDRIAIAAFIGASAALVIQRRWTWALYTALSLLPVLLSGTPMSATRILSVVFPAFVALAILARSERAQLAVALPCFAMQILLFVNWVRFDWAG
jgi:hypothetical protein